jgi:hypothetical protein
MRSILSLVLSIKCALPKLSDDMRGAHLRPRIPTTIMAARAFITRTMILRVEGADPGISVGSYATVLFTLRPAARLAVAVRFRRYA